MRFVFALIVGCLLILGCFGTTPPEQQYNQTGTEEVVNDSEIEEPEEEGQIPGGEGTIIEAPSGPGGEEPPDYTGPPATSQEECATMTPDCESCISKTGCGWCKFSNSCLIGTSSGPSVSSCPPDQWTVSESGCSVVEEEEDCYDLTNCAFCLSGSGCKWCIQGSLCAPESSTEECFGDWLTESYQCNYASR